jgi:hypothetical protein
MQRLDDFVAAEFDGGVAGAEVVGERRVLGVDVVLAAAELAVRPAVGAGLGARELRAGQSFAAAFAFELGLRAARAVAELRELLADEALRVLFAVDAVVLGLQELRDLPLVGVEQFGGALLERVRDLRVRVAGQDLRAMPWATVRARFSPFAAIARLRRSASRTSRKCSGRT